MLLQAGKGCFTEIHEHEHILACKEQQQLFFSQVSVNQQRICHLSQRKSLLLVRFAIKAH